jgi:hypothetical protein
MKSLVEARYRFGGPCGQAVEVEPLDLRSALLHHTLYNFGPFGGCDKRTNPRRPGGGVRGRVIRFPNAQHQNWIFSVMYECCPWLRSGSGGGDELVTSGGMGWQVY